MKLDKNSKPCNALNVHRAFPCSRQFTGIKNRSSHVAKNLCIQTDLACSVHKTKNLNNYRPIVRCREAPHGKLGRKFFILGIALCLKSTFNSGV